MFPPECGEWEYKDHPKYPVLAQRCQQMLIRAQTTPATVTGALADTRASHGELFLGLTLPGQEYLAGNYRGAPFHCLLERPVGVFPFFKGAEPARVEELMSHFHQELDALVRDLVAAASKLNKKKKSGLTDGEYLYAISAGLAYFLTWFFTIHPYANGNGHIGRYIVWLVLIKLKRFPRGRWTFNDRPPYDDAVQQHREGNVEPLRRLILKVIRG